MDNTLRTEILHYLKHLGKAQQVKVLNYIKSLTKTKDKVNAELLSFAGSLDKASAEEMSQAIEEGCEAVWENE